jgi:hypothetical protein
VPDQNEIKNSVARSLFSLINVPILGPVLTEVFDFRGKLKQDRLNQFTELLENYFSNHSGINLENFRTVEFSDLFESVLKRVVINNSIEKMSMLKNVLIKQIENPSQNIEESEIYLTLVSELTEIEIQILFEYRKFINSFQPQINELNLLEHKLGILESKVDKSQMYYSPEILDMQTKIGEKTKELNKLQNIYKHDYFGITKDQFLFYKQRLFSKGLLVDNGVGSIGGKSFTIMGITQFGIQFIDYIITS